MEVEASLAELYRCNLHLRSASRVVVRLGSFYAAAFSELRKKPAASLGTNIYNRAHL